MFEWIPYFRAHNMNWMEPDGSYGWTWHTPDRFAYYVAFAPYMKRYMERSLAYGFMPGFFSPKSAADDSHYFAHPEFYERDRPFFKKYIPLCRLVSEAGWRPLNTLLPGAAAGDVSAEQFGDRYVALFNHSTSKSATVKIPREMRELVSGEAVKESVTLEPETCRVLDFGRRNVIHIIGKHDRRATRKISYGDRRGISSPCDYGNKCA